MSYSDWVDTTEAANYLGVGFTTGDVRWLIRRYQIKSMNLEGKVKIQMDDLFELRNSLRLAPPITKKKDPR